MKKSLTIVAAIAKNNVIGNENTLPWNLPDDWNRMKKIVKDNQVIMGRNTYESKEGFLTKNNNYILSRNSDLNLPSNGIQCKNVNELLEAVDGEAYVLGGGKIYDELLPHVNRMLITHVEAEVEGNVKFPDVDYDQWTLLQSVFHPPNEKHQYGFYYNEYVRNVE